MRILSFIVGGILACAASFGIVHAQVGVLAPAVTVTPLTAGVATQIIGQNPSRKSIQICNSGTTVVMIWPGVTTTFVSAYELPALSSGTTTCFTPPNGFGPPGTGSNSAGNSWGANSFTGTGSISVFEW